VVFDAELLAGDVPVGALPGTGCPNIGGLLQPGQDSLALAGPTLILNALALRLRRSAECADFGECRDERLAHTRVAMLDLEQTLLGIRIAFTWIVVSGSTRKW
jgi:hypothetical protein